MEKSALAERCINTAHQALFNHTNLLAQMDHYWERVMQEEIEISIGYIAVNHPGYAILPEVFKHWHLY